MVQGDWIAERQYESSDGLRIQGIQVPNPFILSSHVHLTCVC